MPVAVAVAAALAVALAVLLWPAEPEPTGPTSVAVLPFVGVAGAAGQAHITEGVADALIMDLANIEGVTVIARQSSFAFGPEPTDLSGLAAELGVRTVLAGRLEQSDGRLRLDVRLVDGRSGDEVWAEGYEGGQGDMAAVIDQVTAGVLAALAIEPNEGEARRIAHRPTDSPEALDFYIRAEHAAHGLRADALADVLAHYDRALALDPGFADAYAGYARAILDVLSLDYQDPVLAVAGREEARDAATQALALNPDSARTYAVLGLLDMLDGAHDDAIAAAQRAVALAPGSAAAHHDLAVVLTYAGRHGDALAEMGTMLRLDPRPAPAVREDYALVLFMNRRFTEAVAALEGVAPGARSLFGLETLAMAHARLEQPEQAAAAVDILLDRSPLHSLAGVGVLYGHHRLAEDLEFRVEALRDAGLGQWPAGFSVREADRVDGATLRDLAVDRRWVGRRRYDGGPVSVHIAADGALVMRIADTLVEGSASVDDDRLCFSSPAATLGRPFCGFVYRNPTGSAEMQNEHYYPTLFGVLYFTTVP